MIKCSALTDTGLKRELNQDFVFSKVSQIGTLPNLFIVADGMGGHNAGDYASSFTANFIVESIAKSTVSSPIRVIREAIEEANSALIEQSYESPEKRGMGTTVVVATIVDGYLYVANVGDSRLYLINENIDQITRDHSLVEEMVRAGKLARADARLHPDKNIITRAIGAQEEVNIDFFDMRLRPGDFILMCTDGLSNMVPDEDIKAICDRERSVEGKARALIKAANDNGGKDNIGVIIADPFGDMEDIKVSSMGLIDN